MAIRYAIASGNWSNAAIWDSGLGVPTSADDVYANGFTVTIDQTITVLTLRNLGSASPVIATGGGFTYSGNYNVTCTGVLGLVLGSATLLTYTGTSNVTVNTTTITTTSTTNTSVYGINITGACTFNITSTSSFSGGGAASRYAVYIANVNAVVNITAPTIVGGSNSTGAAVAINQAATVSITANLTSSAGNPISFLTGSACTANITCSTFSVGSGACISISSSANIILNISGSVNSTGTGGQFVINSVLSTGQINVIGNISGGSTSTSGGIQTTGSVSITVNGNLYSGTGTTSQAININTSGGTASVNVYGTGAGSGYATNTNPVVTWPGSANGNLSFSGNVYTGATNNFALFIYGGGSVSTTVSGSVFANSGPNGYTIFVTSSTNCFVTILGSIVHYSGGTSGGGVLLLSGSGQHVLNVANQSITGGTGTAPTITINSNTALTINGDIYAGNLVPAVVSTSLLYPVTVVGNVYNNGVVSGLAASSIRFGNGNFMWGSQQRVGIVDSNYPLYSIGVLAAGVPSANDVKVGVTYGPSSEFTGLLATSGNEYTLQEIANAVWGYATSSANVAGSMGERLKNAATVESTGNQLAYYVV